MLAKKTGAAHGQALFRVKQQTERVANLQAEARLLRSQIRELEHKTTARDGYYNSWLARLETETRTARAGLASATYELGELRAALVVLDHVDSSETPDAETAEAETGGLLGKLRRK